MGQFEPQPPVQDEPTIGKLVVDAFDDLGLLLRNVIALAKSEMKVSAKTGGIGIALFALAGFLVLLAIVMVSFSAAYFIVMAGLDPAWAFLIVFGAYLLIATLLGFIGYLKVRKVRAPEKTIAQVQELPRTLLNQP
jgi:hypothetical protein